MRNSIIAILAFFLFTGYALDKESFSFDDLIDYSDYIVVGEVSKQDSFFYQFKISIILKGEIISKTISINKYSSWTCEPRENYETGEKAILFLYNIDDTLRTCGGSDGEIFYTDSNHIRLNHRVEASLSEYKEAIRQFNSCVSLGHKKYKKSIGGVSYIWNYELTNRKYFKMIDKNNPISSYLAERLNKKKRVK